MNELEPPARSEPLDAEQHRWLEARLAAAAELATRYAAQPGSGLPPPEALDRVLDVWRARPASERESAREIQEALGAALGEHLARIAGLGWIVVKDEEGADLAIHGVPGELLVYPFTVVAKRLEAGEPLAARELVTEIEHRWRELSEAWAEA
jgi:hypothetical protein